jgi:glutamate--cysteine ligase
MPSEHPSLRREDAVRFIEERCFPSGQDAVATAGSVRCGVEIEWLTGPVGAPEAHLPIRTARGLVEVVGDLPGGSRVTLEPGGQIELSSLPGSPSEVCRLMEGDAAIARRRLGAAGVSMTSLGLDPVRPERRVLDSPRYAAMEQFFDRHGPDGRSMMCASASIQVNLDLGVGDEQEERWRLANLIGPMMTAAFANSPFRRGAPSGWRSSRAAVWRMLDLSRTSPVPLVGNAANAWARYALNAQVMLVRAPSGTFLPGLEHLTFGAWMARGHAVGFPVEEDLGYHLTTLFPPVRPRGWLELRFVDSLPDPWWRVPVLVATALVCDARAAAVAWEACRPAAGLWAEAARQGLEHPVLAAAAASCFDAVIEALDRLGADPTGREAVQAYAEHYVARGRCPADDLLEAWASSGAVFPPAGDEFTDGRPLETVWTR